MKVLSIAILKWKKDTPEPVVLCQECELSQFNYFQKTAVKQMLTFISRTLIQRTNFAERQSVSHEEYMCHCYLRQDGLGAVIVTDKEYPARVAFNLETKLLDDFDTKYMARWKNAKEDNQFPVPTLAKTLQDYQDPAKCDKITQINTQIDETKNVLNKTIDSVLERGTKLDDLVGKSNDLSDHILLRWSRWWLTGRVEDVLQAGEKDELMLYDYVSFCFWCLFSITFFYECRYGNVDGDEDNR